MNSSSSKNIFLPGSYERSGNFVSFQEKEKERRKSRCSFEKALTMVVYFFVLTVSFIGILHGISLFWIGYHNQDSGHNLRLINCEQGTDYVDYYEVDKFYTPHEQIVLGNDQQLRGFVFTVICISIFFICLGLDIKNVVKEIDLRWR